MIDEKYIRLMHQEIDGENSPEQCAELEAYLASNPEAQDFYRELKNLSSNLDAVERLEPPPNLAKRIINAIPKNKYKKRQRSRTSESFLASLKARLDYSYVYAFSGGLAVGALVAFLLLSTMGDASLNISHLAGTLRETTTIEDFDTIHVTRIDAAEVQGTVRFKRKDRTILSEITLNAPEQIELLLRFDAPSVGLHGVSALEETGLQTSSGPGAISLTHVGAGTYALIFEQKAPAIPPMDLRIYFDGKLVHQQSLHIESRSE